MENEKLESLLIDYIDGKLSESEHRKVEQELLRNPEAVKLYEQLKEVIEQMNQSSMLEPSNAMRTSFDKMLNEEIKASKKGRVISFRPSFYRMAAAVALLVIGGGAGFWISHQRQQAELNATKLALMTMLENNESASQRVLGATVAFNQVDHADHEIVTALVNAMNEDPNTNVRLAALEALGKFSQEMPVKKALIASLNTQKDPMVQIALIRMLVEMKQKEVVQELEHITTDESVLKEVRDEAHAGILRLS